jgi:hypothetical protein
MMFSLLIISAGFGKEKPAGTGFWTYSLEPIEADPRRIGFKGSPTWVKRIFSPHQKEGGPVFDAQQDPQQAVNNCLNLLFSDETFATKFLKYQVR